MKILSYKNMGLVLFIAHFLYAIPSIFGIAQLSFHEGTLYGFIGTILEIPGILIVNILDKLLKLDFFELDITVIIFSSIFYFLIGTWFSYAVEKYRTNKKVSSL